MISPSADKKKLRNFGWLFVFVFALLHVVFFPDVITSKHEIWVWTTLLFLAIISTVAPNILTPAYRVWMSIGHVLGTINSYILLTFVFIFMIIPIGLLKKLFTRKKGPEDSYLIRNERKDLIERMDKPY